MGVEALTGARETIGAERVVDLAGDLLVPGYRLPGEWRRRAAVQRSERDHHRCHRTRAHRAMARRVSCPH
jgi:hypothetical protein